MSSTGRRTQEAEGGGGGSCVQVSEGQKKPDNDAGRHQIPARRPLVRNRLPTYSQFPQHSRDPRASSGISGKKPWARGLDPLHRRAQAPCDTGGRGRRRRGRASQRKASSAPALCVFPRSRRIGVGNKP